MNSQKILLVFTLAIFGQAQKIDYRLFLEQNSYALAPKNCTEPGFMCEDCQKLVMCMQIGENEYEKKPISTCQSPTTCLDKQCSTSPNPVCSEAANFDFVCNSPGVFPDPFDCQKYHFCVPSYDNGPPYSNYKAYCNNKWSYNALTKVCDKELTSGCDTTPANLPVPICDPSNPNTMVGALKENPSIFYVCSAYENTNILYPFLDICPNGQIFDNYACKNKSTSP